MGHQLGKELGANVVNPTGRHQLKDLGLKDIDTGTGQRRFGVLGQGLFLEGFDASIGCGQHHAIRADFCQGHVQGHQARDRAFGMVLGNGRSNVEVDQRITAQHQRGFIKKAAEILDSAHAAGRAHGSGRNVTVVAHPLVGIANFHAPAAAITKILFNFLVVVGHVHHDFRNTVARQVLNQVFHHRFAQNGHHGLGQVACQRAYPCALPRRQNHAFCHRASRFPSFV